MPPLIALAIGAFTGVLLTCALLALPWFRGTERREIERQRLRAADAEHAAMLAEARADVEAGECRALSDLARHTAETIRHYASVRDASWGEVTAAERAMLWAADEIIWGPHDQRPDAADPLFGFEANRAAADAAWKVGEQP